MGTGGGWLARLRGLVITGGFVVAGIALAGPPGGYLHGTIYPWWMWVLVATGATAGVALLLAPDGGKGPLVRTAASCVALVAGAELTGTGVVAAEHWRPASGMADYGVGQLPQVEFLAISMALAAGAATLAAAWQVHASRLLARGHWTGTSWAQVVFGVALVVLLPALVAAFELNPELSTWGAVGLIYAGPWGVALGLSAWSTRPATIALVASTLGCAALAGIGPQMVSLVPQWADVAFMGVAFGLAGLLVVVRGPVPRPHFHHRPLPT